jgi:hypothetical protein
VGKPEFQVGLLFKLEIIDKNPLKVVDFRLKYTFSGTHRNGLIKVPLFGF